MRQLTARAIGTGIVLGALLTPCNIYSGLKIGWSFNMSIAAALLSLAFWQAVHRVFHGRSWLLGENAINQTAASSAASIVSGGLVAPIPALTLLTGQTLSPGELVIWVFAVSALGIFVAFALRRQLLVRERATFPAGVATAETLRDIYERGEDAVGRVRVLLGAAILSASLKLYDALLTGGASRIPRLNLPVALPITVGHAPAPTLANLTFGFEPSLLMVGFGAIIGIRVGLSLAVGAVLAWGLIAPLGLARGWIESGPPDPTASWFGSMIEWLLWPGVAMMVSSSITALVLAIVAAWSARRHANETSGERERPVHRETWFWIGLLGLSGLLVGLQYRLFGIDLVNAVFAIPVAFLLGSVAARVVAETGIPPIGALGKVSQATFAITAPANPVANLMTANVAGGTAGQCADLFNDLKTGQMLGIRPGGQFIAQFFGILTGAIVGSLVYLVLIPDPQAMLLTEQWAAPAVATWKAVAEALSAGLDSIGTPARVALVLGAVAGVVLEWSRRSLSPRLAAWMPSAPALGLAFVIPASLSFAMFLGSLLAWLFARYASVLAARYTLAIAAGLVAGESLAGVGAALIDLIGAS